MQLARLKYNIIPLIFLLKQDKIGNQGNVRRR